MSKELSFIDLVSAMRAEQILIIRGEFLNEKSCIINGIGREDGSGRRWIVTVSLVHSKGSIGIYWDESKPCPFIAAE